MEYLWHSFIKFCKVFWSYVVALARLIIWTFIFFFTGLQRTLFMRSEIVEVDFKVMPLRCDMEAIDDKMAYIDKLYMSNPDMIEGIPEEDMPFDDLLDDDIDFRSEDEDNGEDKE
jgi:hypothetical protein